MDSVLTTFQEAGAFAFVHLAVAALGGLWALVCAVLLAMRWRVPPIVAVAPLILAPFVVAVGASWSASQVTEALAYADPAQRAALQAAGISGTLAQAPFGLLAVPVAFLLAVGGLAAGLRAPRRWGVPALVFLVAGLTALLPAIGLAFEASLPSVVARVLLYGLAAIPLALSTASDHRRSNGLEGGMVAAAAYVAFVGATELSVVSGAWAQGFSALAMVDPDMRGKILAALSEEVGAQGTLAWAMFVVAGVPAVVCAFRSGPELTEAEILDGEASPSPWRSLARLLALGVWLAWALAFVAASPGDAIETIALLSAGKP